MSRRLNPILYLTLVLLALSCRQQNEPQEASFEFSSLPLEQKLRKAIDKEYLELLGIDDDGQEFLVNLYASNAYQPFWVNDSMLTDKGVRLSVVLDNKLALGIPDARRYHPLLSEDNFIQQELKLTLSAASLIRDLGEGFLIPDSCAYQPMRYASTEQWRLFHSVADTGAIDRAFMDLGPSDTIYPALAQFLFDEYHRLPLDKTRFEIKPDKKNMSQAFSEARKALVSKGYLTDDAIDSTAIAEGLKSFQRDNQLADDGVVGKVTAFALNESSYDRLNRIALAMERQRWRKTYPNKFVLVNLPEYTLRFYINDSLKSRHNIVIGKWGNETPQISSRIRRIIVYPYWKVPYSICSKEILPAAKSNPNYFAKNNYRVYRKEEEIDPLTVNWRGIREDAFPYTVIQDPGPKNSLGILKFDMPNSQSIYIHDTPSKSLFSTKTRAYSHGCMRCQYPTDLAKIILERDENYREKNPMIADSLDTLLGRKAHYVINLLDPIPVIMEYRTVVVDEGQLVRVFPDIYGREGEYLQLFKD